MDEYKPTRSERIRAGVEKKTVHRAKMVNTNGDVSAVCFSTPRKINLKIATWTLVAKLVTCPKCKTLS